MRSKTSSMAPAGTNRNRRTLGRSNAIRRTPVLAGQRPLFTGSDHGAAIRLTPKHFGAREQGGGWGPSSEAFLRMNERMLAQMDVRLELRSSKDGPNVFLIPGANAGAVPLRSAT